MNRVHILAATLLIGVASSAVAQGAGRKFDDLLRRVPSEANAMVLVDVDALLNSPLGRREKWRDRAAERPTGVLGVSADASRFVVAAGLDLSTLEERWKVGMLATHGSPPGLATLAAREGGYVEQLQTQSIAWTPRNVYLVSFPEKIVGFAVPSDRQLVSAWMRNLFIKPRTFPAGWADPAVNRAEAGSPIVLAINLDDAIAPKSAEAWLKGVKDQIVQNSSLNFDVIGSKLAGAKSAMLQIDVKESIEGTIRIEFDSDLTILKPIARKLILTFLSDFGAEIDDLDRWTFDVKDKSITLSGRLSEDAVRRFMRLVAAPKLSSTNNLADSAAVPPPASETTRPAPASTPGGEPSRDAVIKATQQYYRSVVDITRGLKTQKATSQNALRIWYDRAAREIEELPLLYVDNDVLDWGGQVAKTIREMCFGINYSNRDSEHRIAGTANGGYGGYGYGGSRAVSAGVIKKQNGAVLDVTLDGTWKGVETSIGEMRRKLVEKYKVDF